MKQKYIEAPILKSPNWDIEFHVHINESLLDISYMLPHNLIEKHDQFVVYVSRLLNIEHKETTIP
jgi:hypothetical protein